MLSFNNQIKQVMILFLLLSMIFLVVKELYIFFPGLLGALTLYILSRSSYFQLVYHYKWRKGWTAGLYLFVYFLLLTILVYFIFILLEKKVQPFLNDPTTALSNVKAAILEVQQKEGITLVSEETLVNLQQKISNILPSM